MHRLRTVRRLLLHAVDEVLKAPTAPSDKFKEPLSLSKLVKDGSWNTTQVMLGWLVDSVRKTIELPDHRKQRLLDIFKSLKGLERVSKKKWMSLLGELRFASIGIPGSKGLFCILQLALSRSDKGRVRVTPAVRQHLASFERLVKDLAARPTKLAEIIPDQPRLVGAHDSSGYATGGVYFSEGSRPVAWRSEFPKSIQARLVSSDNPKGDINNSDLEQAGGIAQLDVMARHYDLREITVANLTDNTPTMSRAYRGATTTDGPGAFLCQLAAEHQRLHRYCNEMSFLNGDLNVMADDASRLVHLSDTAFLAHMNSAYPQQLPWELRPLCGALKTSLLRALRREPPQMPSRSRPSRSVPPPLDIGPSSVPTVVSSTPSRGINLVRESKSSRPLSDTTGTAVTPSKPGSLSELVPYLAHSVPSARRSHGWWTRKTPRIPSFTPTPNSTPSPSKRPFGALPEEILLRDDNGLSPSACSSTSAKQALRLATKSTNGALSRICAS